MGQRIRSSSARYLAVLVASLLLLGCGSPGTPVSAAGYVQQAELTAPGTAGGEFGLSVALSASGTTALAGDAGTVATNGAVYVLTRRGGTWSRAAELTASDGAQDDEFGSSVALSASGTTALVGAYMHSATTGAAYVFTLRDGTWSQTAELTASDGAQGDEFGRSVALSALGTTALAGATPGNGQTGTVYVFTLRGGTWSQAAELTASDGKGSDQFGASVALSASGTTALAGAPGRNSGGALYVFRLRSGTWSQAAELTASHKVRNGAFGSSVALSSLGTTALIGASLQSAAYVFAGGSPG